MHRYALLLVIAFGCDDGPTTVGDAVDDPQLPPRGSDDLLAWIEAGYYQSWTCEPVAHPARSGSPHGANRICSNDLIAGSSGTGPYPVGAAGIKEIFSDSGAITLYAVYRKVDAGEGGDTWYWFEGKRGNIAANGEGESGCTGCHSGAPRDFVFTAVGRD
jgi:hypothetical protein